MPAGDGTGPMGLGPMTGRAAGYCAGYSVPGYMNPIPGRFWYGRGYGWPPMWYGGGRGWRNWYYATGLPGWSKVASEIPAFRGMMYPTPDSHTCPGSGGVVEEDREEADGALHSIPGPGFHGLRSRKRLFWKSR